MDVTQLRQQIPACQQMIYMNTGWSGPSPVRVVEAIKTRLEYESYQGPTSREVQESGRRLQHEAEEAAASLLNGSSEEICLTESTTEGLNIVISGLPWRRGDEVVTCDLEHSSVLVPAYYLQRRHGVVVRVAHIPTDADQDTILERIEGALTPRTRLVFLSHIQYSCGLRMPVEEIGRLIRPRGVRMLLDGAQTAGHVALDVGGIGCDFYSIPGQKWLLGPDGVGALFVRKELIPELEPMKVSNRAVTSYDMEGGFEPNASSMTKFQITTTSVPLRAGFLEAVRFIQEIGVPEIERQNQALAATVKEALQEIPGVMVLSPMGGSSASGLVSFRIEGVEPQQAVEHLWEQHRVVARQVREMACVRLSLHFFNTEEEIGRVVEAVRGLAG